MNEQLERMVNIVKEELKNMNLIEVTNLAAPVMERYLHLIDEFRVQDKMLEWGIERKKSELKKLSDDIELLKSQQTSIQEVIESQKKQAIEDMKSMKEETKNRLAEATKLKREAELIKEELEKQKYMAAIPS